MIRQHTLHFVCVIFSLSGLLSATAFASPSFTPRSTSSKSSSTLLRESGDFSELTSQLARLDKQFQIELRSKTKKSRWSKLQLETKNDDDDDDDDDEKVNNPEDYVWLLEPPSVSSIPSCVIVFTGGAGLGQFPHIAYNELLSRVSDRLNAACITAPYSVGLDHMSLAKKVGELQRRALIACQEDPSKQYPENIPTYALTHSLGGKLNTIYVGATGQHFDGIGLMSFNNFSFGDTISMARMFAEQIRKNMRPGQFAASPLGDEQMMNTVFSFAENIVKGIGFDFTPNAKDTERLIQLRYDDILQSKTRLFVFDEDNLDNSKEFMENCSGGPGPSASGLPGGHLAPVFLKLGLDDLELGDVPPDAREMAKEAMGGFQSASFGDEQVLNELVDEICDWVLGKSPKRSPQWDAVARNQPPRLAGFTASE
jgi:hypothetical protein